MSYKKLFWFALTCSAAIAVTIPFASNAEKLKFSSGGEFITPEAKFNQETKIAATEDEPQVLSFEVTPAGFQPSETVVGQGKFLILLQNRTGRRDLHFWLARENEGRVADSDSQKRDWKARVRLYPGTYILGETDHAEWKSVIRVTN